MLQRIVDLSEQIGNILSREETKMSARFETFAALHVPGAPVILFNVWDAGSAAVAETAGAKAIATGSASVATANGYDDAESLSLKTQWAMQQGFRGVFFWQIGGDLMPDATFPLQEAARKKLDETTSAANNN